MEKSALKKCVNLYHLQCHCECLLSKCQNKEKKKDLFRLSDNLERILELWETYNLSGDYNRIIDIDGIDMCVIRGELADENFAVEQLKTVKNADLAEELLNWIHRNLE